MSNFKQIHGDNILQFRLREQSRPQPRQEPGNKLKRTHFSQKTTSQTSLTPEQNKKYVRLLSSKGNPTQELVDECAPSIVRRIIKHVRMHNRPSNHLPKNLPRVLSRQLQLLYDFDHPAGDVLKDWLIGNLDTLPDDFEETYARTSNRKEVGHDEG